MLRFVPDSWLELLLRPLLLADPLAGLYSEIQAPDWRYVALLLFLFMGFAAHRNRAVMNGVQWRFLIGTMLAFYLWTLVSGNGRYYIWGLLAVGPLVVVAARRVRSSRAMRNTLIAGVALMQGWLVWIVYEPNAWTQQPWHRGPGLSRLPTTLAERPAVFLTTGTNSYSILVPQMHPQSRWSNVRGQQDLVPGMPEWRRLQSLLASPLPKYGVLRTFKISVVEDAQDMAVIRSGMRNAFKPLGLAPTDKACSLVMLGTGGVPTERSDAADADRGFWFCELSRHETLSNDPAAQLLPAPELDDVFLAVERLCPRFFPTGNAITRTGEYGAMRFYSQSDVSINIQDSGDVYFRSRRVLNPTLVATVQGLRAGRAKIDCDRLPGRYRAPWRRGWDINFD